VTRAAPALDYCFVTVKLPLSATVQLNAAYVPFMLLPETVVVALNGQVRGSPGSALNVSDDPLIEPVTVPPLSAVVQVP
jgi:hypothetical protein